MGSNSLQRGCSFVSHVGSDQSSRYRRVRCGIPRERASAILLTDLEGAGELSEELFPFFKRIEPQTEELMGLMATLALRMIRAHAISSDMTPLRSKKSP